MATGLACGCAVGTIAGETKLLYNINTGVGNLWTNITGYPSLFSQDTRMNLSIALISVSAAMVFIPITTSRLALFIYPYALFVLGLVAPFIVKYIIEQIEKNRNPPTQKPVQTESLLLMIKSRIQHFLAEINLEVFPRLQNLLKQKYCQ